MSYIYILNIQISYNIYNIYMEGGKIRSDKLQILTYNQAIKKTKI